MDFSPYMTRTPEEMAIYCLSTLNPSDRRGGSLKTSITRAFISYAQGNARGLTSEGIKLCSCRQLNSTAQRSLHMKMETKGEQELHSLRMLGELVVF